MYMKLKFKKKEIFFLHKNSDNLLFKEISRAKKYNI